MNIKKLKLLFLLMTVNSKKNVYSNNKSNNLPLAKNPIEEDIKIGDIPSYLLKHRIICLSGTINKESTSLIISQLIYLNMRDATKPIILYIGSNGGDLYSGLAIVDAIKSIKAPVYTVAIGFAGSAAALVLSVGEKIYATKYATIGIHQPSGETKGQTTDLTIHVKEMNRKKLIIAKIMFEAIEKRKPGKITFEKFLEILERDTFFDTKEAIELGLVDEELTSKFI